MRKNTRSGWLISRCGAALITVGLVVFGGTALVSAQDALPPDPNDPEGFRQVLLDYAAWLNEPALQQDLLALTPAEMAAVHTAYDNPAALTQAVRDLRGDRGGL